MKEQHNDLLDAPLVAPQRFPLWATVGAAGIVGVLMSAAFYINYMELFKSTISVHQSLWVPPWLKSLTRASGLSLLFGVVLTVLRKEPKSTFRSWVIGIGSLLLMAVILLIGFTIYVDASRS